MRPEDVIDRESETERLVSLAAGGHAVRLVAPRRYGKTSCSAACCRRRRAKAGRLRSSTWRGCSSLSSLVVRIERAYDRDLAGGSGAPWTAVPGLAGRPLARRRRLHRVAPVQSALDVESVLLRLLDLPAKVHERTGARSLIAFDEFQDLLRVDGADGILRSVIQHQSGVACLRVRGLGADAHGEALRGSLAAAARPRDRGRTGPAARGPTAEYVEERFRRTGRDIGDALDPLLAFARGHPQRTMLLAHRLWELVPRGSVADEEAWVDARRLTLADAEPALRARGSRSSSTSSASPSRSRRAPGASTRRRP